MITTPAAYLKNPWLRWFWEHGGEEIVGPHGPFVPGLTLGPNPNPWGPTPNPWGPTPDPWRAVVAQLVQAAVAKDLAGRLEGGSKSELAKSAGGAIDKILDDWCGTPPKIPLPWPWPGPPPWTWEIVSGLSLVANSLQPGSLRDGILDIASQAAKKAGMAR
jgi:hypothetical protein